MGCDILDIYSDYLIAQSQQATATGLSTLLDGSLSHDQITRFLNRNEFSSKDLWHYVKPKEILSNVVFGNHEHILNQK
jgi:hypothetical protein